MSTTIDQRVVEMQFDNRHFEKNVQTTMSSLDKLKQKLHLPGATKGLEDVNAASKKVNMSGLGAAVESVSLKFSALQVMGVTALANITNSAVNAGKRIVSALTIDPIKTGFQEYETQINAVQTILANTESKGTTIDDVNKALDTLNTYADKTIYNFTEMTRNIGTFTAAGVDLDTSVSAIQGIANLAAVSGSTSQQASTAMYQLSQALASGTVKLMDWNSVVNAGMGGEVFQNALKETARVHGVAIDGMIERQGSFRETLKDGWLTSEILTETLEKFTMTTEGLTEAEIEANREKLKGLGYTDEQIEGIFKLGNTATNAATKVKTFTQLWDVMKESAQSGWSKTWKLLIGDFEDAKNLLTPLADFFTNIINKMSDARNKLLESALGKGFTNLFDGLNKALDKTQSAVDGIVKPLESLDTMVDKIMKGELGNGEVRWNKLTEAGHNWCVVQNKVNEVMGDSFRYSEEQIAEQDRLLASQGKTTEGTKEQGKAVTKLTDEDKKLIKELANLSDAQLRAKGYTEDQIEAFRELRTTAEKLGIPLNDFIDNLDQINGRWLLINSFKNIGQGIIKVFKAIGDAWREIFDPVTADGLFNAIAGFHKFSSMLNITDDTAKNIKRTFKGLFAALDIVLTLVGGPLKIAFKVLTQILGMFDLNIWDVTAIIGDSIVRFRDFIDATLDFTKIFENIIPTVKNVVKAIKEWFSSLKDSDNIGLDIVKGLVNGITTGLGWLWDAAVMLGTKLIETVEKVLGIESPSKEFFEIGKNIIQGLINGIKSLVFMVFDLIGDIGVKAGEILGKFDWGKIIAVGIGVGTFTIGNKIAGALSNLTAPLEGLGDMFEGIGDAFQGLGKYLKAQGFAKRAEGIRDLAIAVGILVASLWVLTLIDTDKLWPALGALVAIIAAVGGLAFALGKMSESGNLKVLAFGAVILSIGIAMLLLAAVCKIIATMSWEELGKAGLGILAFGGIIVGLIAITKLGGRRIQKTGKVIKSVGTAMLLMAIVAKIMAGMSWEDMLKAGIGIGFFGLIISGLLAATKLAGGGKKIQEMGKVLKSVGTAMLLMAIVAKILAGMSWDDMLKAGVGIAALGGMIVGLIAATKLAGNKMQKIGSMLRGVGVAMLLMAVTAKLIATMSWDDMIKAGVGVSALGGIIVGLIAATKLAGGGDQLKRVGATILLVSISIGILGVVATMLGLLDIDHLAKGITAVGILGLVMMGLIKATKGAENCKGNIIAMTAAIAVMAVAVAALSFIDSKKLAVASGALSLVMGMFALIVKTGSKGKASITSIVVMTLAIGALAGILWFLSDLPTGAAIESAIALSLLLSVMAGVLALLGVIGKFATNVGKGILALTLLAIPLIAFALVLSEISDTTASMDKVLALCVLMSVFSVLLLLLAGAGALIIPALLGIVALTAMVIPLAVFAWAISNMTDASVGAAKLEGVITIMTTMTGLLIILAAIGPMALLGVTALAGLTLLMVAIGALAVAIGALFTEFPALQEFLDTGLPILEQLALSIGTMIGNFVAGFGTAIAEALPNIGLQLSAFMVAIQPFIMGAKMVDGAVLEGVGILTAAIIALSVAEIIEAVASFLSGGGGFADLGLQLSQFMINALPFIMLASSIDPAALEGVKALAQTILILTAADLLDGLTSWLTGGVSFSEFGAQIAELGPGIAAYSEAVSGIDCEAVKASAEAAKALAQMASDMPNSGGLLGDIMGENDADMFGAQMEAFGHSLYNYGEAVAGVNSEAITASVTAGQSLIDMANTIENHGGVVGWFMGENDLETFGKQMLAFGKNLYSYGYWVTGLNSEAITTSVTAGQSLIDMANTIEDSGGVVSWFAGDNDLETFGETLVSFGSAMKTYSETVDGLNVDAIWSSKYAAQALIALTENLDDSGGVVSWWEGDNDLETFGEGLSDFGEELMDYNDTIADLSTSKIKSVTGIVKDLIDLDSLITDGAGDGLASFAENLGEMGTDGVSKFVEAFDGAHKKVATAASDFINAFNKAIANKANSVKTVFIKVVNASVTAIRKKYQSFYNAGGYLVGGFAAGIDENTYKAEAKAKAMADAAEKAAKEALEVNSPSKVFRRIGMSVPEGFAQGIGRLGSTVKKSVIGMTDTAVDNVRLSVARIARMVDSDIDAQPTIRPVIDLSDVRAGANAIGGMFGMRPSIGLMTNVGSINAMMNHRSQNGVNDDVVTAINKLRDDLGKVGNTTNNINGITYDDGSNISEAIGAIVRAARIGRRA